jgi:Tfp pilus assembly protein PilX
MNEEGECDMERKRNMIFRDESGVALVIAILMITILTLIGVASTFTSTFEIRLSGNKRGSTDAFYTADGGVQTVLPVIDNFNTSSGFAAVETSSLAVDLQNESIDLRNTSPTLSLPSGVNFNDAPTVTVYHTTLTNVPKGSGFSAINFEYTHYIIDSVGRDQKDMGLVRSNCQVREKIVRIIPTLQGGY